MLVHQSQESSIIKQIFGEADIPLEINTYADGDEMRISRLYTLPRRLLTNMPKCL